MIYALLDPDTYEVRYIGKTSSPRRRYLAHRNTRKRMPVHLWWDSLPIEPVMAVVASAIDDDWQSLERLLIAQARAEGARLLNLTDGGDGVEYSRPHPAPSATRQQITKRKHLRRRARQLLVAWRRLRPMLLRQGVDTSQNDAKWAQAASRAPHLFGKVPA